MGPIAERDASRIAAAPTARLAGWQPSGMLDWEGRLTSTVFLAGCPYRCPYCHNPALLSSYAADGSWRSFVSHLREKYRWLDGVVVTGGEPCDDPDLVALLAALGDLGVPVKLDTNGSRPDVLRHVLAEGLVAYVALDVKTIPSRYAALTGSPTAAADVEDSISAILASGVPHEFRTTAFPPAVALDDFADIAASLRGARRFAVQQFRPDVTLEPAAGRVRPYHPYDLREAVRACTVHVPTVLRGA